MLRVISVGPFINYWIAWLAWIFWRAWSAWILWKVCFHLFSKCWKCWKKLKNSIHSNHTQGVEFFSIFQRSASRTIRGLFCRARASNSFSWASSPSCLSCSRFAFGFIGWTRVSHGWWARRFVSLSLADIGVVCVAPKKKARAPGCIWTDEETGAFLSFMQGDETTIGYFNRMKLKFKKKKEKKRCRGRRPWRKSSGSWEQRASAWQQSTATVSSPFFTMVIQNKWPVSFDYAIIIHSIHSMLKNSIHSIQKLMNGPSVSTWSCSTKKKKKKTFMWAVVTKWRWKPPPPSFFFSSSHVLQPISLEGLAFIKIFGERKGGGGFPMPHFKLTFFFINRSGVFLSVDWL